MVDIGKIKQVITSDLLPKEYMGTITDIVEKPTKEGGKSLHMNVQLITPTKYKGDLTVIMIRLPKALTGSGQGDLLLKYMRKMGFTDTSNLIGNDYYFERHSLSELAEETGRKLPASFTENPRHYPVRPVPVQQPPDPDE